MSVGEILAVSPGDQGFNPEGA